MANHTQTATRDIAAEPDRVWRVLTTLSARDQALSAVSDVQAPEGPFRIGTTWTETRTVNGRKVTQRIEVTELEALGLATLVARGDDSAAGTTTTYKLQALHPGTRLTLSTSGTVASSDHADEGGGAAGLLRKAFTAVASTLGQHDEGSAADADAERELADIAAAAEAAPSA